MHVASRCALWWGLSYREEMKVLSILPSNIKCYDERSIGACVLEKILSHLNRTDKSALVWRNKKTLVSMLVRVNHKGESVG